MAYIRIALEIIESIIVALMIGLLIVFSPILGRWYRRWGATSEESHRVIPGDDIVPTARLVSTRAISIRAPASGVWPWIAQLGQGRGGWYSYELLENLVGCKIRNADRILPEHQEPQIGDTFKLAESGGPYFVAEEIEPGRTLVLRVRDAKTGLPGDYTWAFDVQGVDRESSRLIVRSRNYYERGLVNSLIWRVITDPVQFVMERKMLKGIRKRAEATARS